MQVRNPRDIGLLIKDWRRARSMSQAELARTIGVSRQWVISLESGKATVEMGLVLKALSAVGLICNLRPGATLSTDAVHEAGPAEYRLHPMRRPAAIEFDEVLARTRASGRSADTQR